MNNAKGQYGLEVPNEFYFISHGSRSCCHKKQWPNSNVVTFSHPVVLENLTTIMCEYIEWEKLSKKYLGVISLYPIKGVIRWVEVPCIM